MRRLMAAALAVGMAMGGCAVMEELAAVAKPQVSVQAVQLRQLGLSGGSVDIRLAVSNPNHFRLEGTQVTYQLSIDSVPFGRGTTTRQFLVNAGDSTIVTLPLDFTWSGVGNAGRAVMNTGTLPYRVTGNVRVSSALGALTVPYDHSGRLSPRGGA